MSQPSVDYPDARVTRPDAAFENLRILAVMAEPEPLGKARQVAHFRLLQGGQRTLQLYL
jgi:hypothetical protein